MIKSKTQGQVIVISSPSGGGKGTVIAELLKSFLETTDMIEKKGLQRQQVLIKLFEQLNKYEQSRYY